MRLLVLLVLFGAAACSPTAGVPSDATAARRGSEASSYVAEICRIAENLEPGELLLLEAFEGIWEAVDLEASRMSFEIFLNQYEQNLRDADRWYGEFEPVAGAELFHSSLTGGTSELLILIERTRTELRLAGDELSLMLLYERLFQYREPLQALQRESFDRLPTDVASELLKSAERCGTLVR